MVSLPNIYTYKNLKLLIVIPLVLMLLGLYFSTQIVLDTTLAGGVSIIIQTNSQVNAAALASQISTVLHASAPSVAASPGGVQITLGTNQSLANAETHLLSFYAQKSNYSNYLINATDFSISYQKNASNQTALAGLKEANAGVNASLSGMKLALQSELTDLRPFGLSYNTSTSDVDSMQLIAQNAYTNASSVYENSTIASLHKMVNFTSYSYQSITPTLGQFFLQQLTTIIIVAFILVFFVVLIIFRSPIPSITVVFGAANDIIVALGAMGLFKIPLGVASIGGLLMLIGYSIDTDVLTAIRILRRGEGTPESRAYASMKTGVTMTATAIVSFSVLFIISVIEYVPTYYEIAGVVLMGLIGDVFTTWLGNASIILLYKKSKERI